MSARPRATHATMLRGALAAWAVLAALTVACGSSSSSTPAKPPQLGKIDRACTVDEDCVLADACCGCANGGRRVAIRADQLANHEAAKQSECGGQLCDSEATSTHPSCDAEASCQEGECRVMPHMQSGPATLPPAQ